MEWYIMNSSGVRSMASGLGRDCSEEIYKLSDDCAETLQDILQLISADDPTKCIAKRHLLTENIIRKDLLNIILHTQPDQNELTLTLRLMVELSSQPNELTEVPTDVQTDLAKLRSHVRLAFLSVEFVQKLFSHVKELTDEAGEYEMSVEGAEALNTFLQLLGNVIHLTQSSSPEQQLAMTGLFLKCNLSTVLVYSLNCHHRDAMTLTATQILSFLYKSARWSTVMLDSQYIAMEDMVTNRLKCFTVQLLQGTLSLAVKTLRKLSIHDKDYKGDENMYAWLIAHFITQLDAIPVPLEKLESIFSSKCIGYLAYQASTMYLELRNQPPGNCEEEIITRITTIFTAIEVVLTAASRYALQATGNEMRTLLHFYEKLYQMVDLRQILLLYLRHFDIAIFPRSFLAKLVCINHKLLSSMEFYSQACKLGGDCMMNHIKQFATLEVASKYAILLPAYQNNSDDTNLAVFTMLCHVCLDCSAVEKLYQPHILKSLKDICELNISGKLTLSEDQQLAQYVIDSFLRDLSENPKHCVESLIGYSPVFRSGEESQLGVNPPSDVSANMQKWSEEIQCDLLSAYAEHNDKPDPIAAVTDQLARLGHIISTTDVQRKLAEFGYLNECAPDQEDKTIQNAEDCFQELIDSGSCADVLQWLQDALLTVSFMKANPDDNCCYQRPVLLFGLKCLSHIPLLPYTEALERGLVDPRVRKLLQHMNLLAEDENWIPQINTSHSAEQLFKLAEMISPVDMVPIAKCDSLDSFGTSGDEMLMKTTSEPEFESESNMYQSSAVDHNVWLRLMNIMK